MDRNTSRLQHHFDNPAQQFEASMFGMWLFLVTEILFFGGLFLAYAVYHWMYPEAFLAGSHHLNVWLGGINTVVLISSSLTMVFAVHAAQHGRSQALVKFLWWTLLLGLVFLGIKTYEYWHKFHEHLVPGNNFQFAGFDGGQIQIFFSIYFGMTGLHALHMVIGMVILAIFIGQASRGKFTAAYYTPIEIMGLYWHFVDIIWIFLFPLLYLLGRH